MKNRKKYGKKADIALNMWVKLARATATFNRLTTENIKTYGLTEPQFAVLECLGHLGGMKITDLSKKMLVSNGNITCVVDNLQKGELAERVLSKEDRRVTLVQLTEKGKKRFDEIFIQHAKYVASISSVLEEKEQIMLANLLKKLGLSLIQKH